MSGNKQEIYLSDEQLALIFNCAVQNKNDFKKFKKIFKSGVISACNNLRVNGFIHKDDIHEGLHNAAQAGDFAAFVDLFEHPDNPVNVDAYYGGNEGESFLYTLIVNDDALAEHDDTIGRINIAHYLLRKGADVNKSGGYDLAGSQHPSPLQLYKKSQHKGVLNFFCPLTVGKNILPIIGQFHKAQVNENEHLSPLSSLSSQAWTSGDESMSRGFS